MSDTGPALALPTGLPADPPAAVRDTDVVVVGTGAAGMAAALRLAESRLRVTMITKDRLGDGSTAWAQGGLAAVTDARDDIAGHAADTMLAGAGLGDAAAVAALTDEAPGAVERLAGYGAVFDRATADGLARGLEGGHTHPRIVHAGGDATGAEIARALARRITHRRSVSGSPEILEQTAVIDVITAANGSARGVRTIDGSGRRVDVAAPAVVIAGGGIGHAWDSTTNPPSATGDGIGMALRAGATIRDAEFVQFHPTMLVVPSAHRRPGDRGVLISEAVRGEGARLVGRDGALIMAGRHPRADLAPRDVVAAAMHTHLLETGAEHVYLDGTRLGAHVWHERFPTILGLCRDRGVDPVTEPIPVRPAEHYACGGVLATLDGVTTVPGLYAIGETASTGVHGANRLASNSLTEAVITGDRLGRLLCSSQHPEPVEGPPHPELVEGRCPEPAEGPPHPEPAEGRCPEPAEGPPHPEPVEGRCPEPAEGPPPHPEPVEGRCPEPAEGPPHPEPVEGRCPEPAEGPPHPGPVEGRCPEPAEGRWAITADARDTLIAAISRGAGVLRDETGLSVLLKTLASTPPQEYPVTAAAVEATNIATVGALVGASALARTESRGCHRRADHPGTDPGWQHHTLARLDDQGRLIIDNESTSSCG